MSNTIDSTTPLFNSNPISKPQYTTKPSGGDIDKDMFLKLLVTQLKYQDPMNPTDPGEFLAQTAQFTTVEKLNEMAKNSAEMIAAQRLTTAAGIVGKAVTYNGADGKPITGAVASARIDETGIVLKVGGKDVPIGDVTSIAPGGGVAS